MAGPGDRSGHRWSVNPSPSGLWGGVWGKRLACGLGWRGELGGGRQEEVSSLCPWPGGCSGGWGGEIFSEHCEANPRPPGPWSLQALCPDPSLSMLAFGSQLSPQIPRWVPSAVDLCPGLSEAEGRDGKGGQLGSSGNKPIYPCESHFPGWGRMPPSQALKPPRQPAEAVRMAGKS